MNGQMLYVHVHAKDKRNEKVRGCGVAICLEELHG
jgi:hypothetical protein